MKRIPIILNTDREQELDKDFFASHIVPIGMSIMDKTDNQTNTISWLFLFENKLDPEDVIYVEAMFSLEFDLELEGAKMNPFNIDNWSDEFKAQCYDKIMEKYEPGKNVYGSDFTFTKTGANGEPELSETAKSLLEGIITPKSDPYYTFEAVYYSDTSNLDIIRKVHLDKGSWLQLSQFIYWIMLSMPVAPNLFTIDSYKKAKFIKVNDMMYDGCTEVLFGQPPMDTIMAHFTLFFDNTINVGSSFGFNVPCELIENSLLSKYIDPNEYVQAYSKDDTVLPDRVFSISSPDKMCCLLTGLREGDILVFTLDSETAIKVDWMNWSKYIYLDILDDKEGITS